MPPESQRPHLLPATSAVFVIALAVHAVVAGQSLVDPLARHLISDALSYHEWALRMVQHGPAAEPVFHQAPLFPLMLAAVYASVGQGHGALAVQLLLNAAAVALLVPLGRLYLGRVGTGVAAALLALLHGPFVFYGLKLLPVAPALLAQVAALCALGVARRGGSLRWAGLAGLGWGLATLVRAEVLLFLPLAALALWFDASPEHRAPRRRAAAVLVLALAWVATLGPATWHNARRGDFVLVASSAGENLFIGNQRGATGGYRELAPGATDIFSQRVAARAEAERALGRSLRPSEISAFWRGRALDEVAADPSAWLGLELRKLARLLDPGDPTDIYSYALERRLYLTALYALPLGPWSLLLLGGIGGLIALRTRPRQTWPLAALVAVHAMVPLLFFVDSRLRLPFLFFLTPFAGHAVSVGLRRWREGRGRGAVAGGAALLAVTCVVSFVVTRPTPRDLTRLAAVLSMEDRLEDALDVLQPELERDDPDPYVLDHAGWIRQKKQDWSSARELYLRALSGGGLDPARARQTRTRLAMVLERLGDPVGAGEQHDLAVASGQANAGTYFERGMFLLRQRRTQEALRDLQHAARLDPNWPAPRRALDSLRRGDPGSTRR